MKMIVDVKMASSSRRENLAKEKERFELQMSSYKYIYIYERIYETVAAKLRQITEGRGGAV